MIKTARQLKDLIRNLSREKSADAQILMRNYMMERFLERISLSEYRDKFILKGGMLVAAMVGLDARSTMDLDATIKGANVNVEDIENLISSIVTVPIDDGVKFQLKSISEIMDEAEYPGIRVSMSTTFDGVVTPLKIDISTGDAITPREVRYSFKLMLEDRSIHNHIIWSSVSLEYDRKFRNFWGSTKAVRQLSDTICIENGLSIVENPKPHGKSYNKWLGDQAKPSHRELLRVAIDNALSQSPANFEELLRLLQESGCEVSKRGKSYRLKLPGWEKAARMDSLGEGYGLDDLQAVLSGKKAHTPRKKIVTQAETQKVNLLVDIQAKLQAGKGAGYARWAKVFNLKQMAQTMNYLSENNLLEYAVLEEKAAAATAHHNELSAQIKAAEKRMAEIAVLRTHIVNYAKTREVYVAYRKAGYSKKFREEHEEEILLHQAAKNAFDEMGVKKLPKVKELQTEYAKLLEEKKKTYAEYRRSREEMRELLTAKANVDRVLKMEVEQDVEKEKDHGQR